MSVFLWHTESQSWLNSLTMRQMYYTVARETKLTLGVTLCIKRCQEDSKSMFQWGGQNMQHFKEENHHLFQSEDGFETKTFKATPWKNQGWKEFCLVCGFDYCCNFKCCCLSLTKAMLWRNSCRSPSNRKIVLIVSCINTNLFKVENMAFSVFSDFDFFSSSNLFNML